MEEPKAFEQTLTNFMNDFASGDAVRHLADAGLTVTEITKRLAFPTKKKLVAEYMHLVSIVSNRNVQLRLKI